MKTKLNQFEVEQLHFKEDDKYLESQRFIKNER